MAELIAEFLILFESFNFWKRKKARRKFGSENHQPKKTLLHPTNLILLLGIVILSIVVAIASIL